MPDFLRALRHRNFRLFFCGQTLSMIGTWMHQIAAMWLVYRLSGSAAMLGLAGFAGQISMLVVAPFAGILCDRMNRHRILLITQSLALMQSLTLAMLAATGLVQVWHVIAAMLVASTINAFDMPARQSMFVHLVEDRADLPNAIALNSMLMNSARLIGPTIAGLVIAAFGETICFFLNAFSYLAILIALLSMRLTLPARKAVATSVWHSLREGLRYAFNTRAIRWLLAILATVSFLINAYVPLMPAFVGEVLHGDARTVGTLISCAGLGAVVGTVLLAARRGMQHLAAFLRVAQLVGAVALTLFALSSSVWLCHMLIVLVGFGMIPGPVTEWFGTTGLKHPQQGVRIAALRHLGQQHVHIPVASQDPADGRRDVARRECGRGHLIEQRLEHVVIAAVHQRDVHGLPAQRLGGRETSEAAADDHDLWYTPHVLTE